MLLRKRSSRKTWWVQTPDWQACERDPACASWTLRDSKGRGDTALFPPAAPRSARLVPSLTVPLARHAGTCFPIWEKGGLKLLHHSHCKLTHFKALILIFETSLKLWLGFQGKTPLFFNARETFRLHEGKSRTFLVVLRQLTHCAKS